MSDLSTQIYEIVIKASAERIWDAITKPEYSVQYFHGARILNTEQRHISHGPDGAVWGDGPVTEWDPPHRLSYEWRSLYDPEMGQEQPSRVTWVIDPVGPDECRVTLTHDRLEGAPKTAVSVSGRGWLGVLEGLRSVCEA